MKGFCSSRLTCRYISPSTNISLFSFANLTGYTTFEPEFTQSRVPSANVMDERRPTGTISWLNSCACAGLPFGLRSTCLELTFTFPSFLYSSWVSVPSMVSFSLLERTSCTFSFVLSGAGLLPDSLFRHLSAAGWHTSRLLITKEERLPC